MERSRFYFIAGRREKLLFIRYENETKHRLCDIQIKPTSSFSILIQNTIILRTHFLIKIPLNPKLNLKGA